MSKPNVPPSNQAADSASANEELNSQAEALDSVVDELAGNSLEAELQEAKLQALRAQAELDNYRKRVRRETDEVRKYAALPVLRDILPVLDNFDRAVQACEPSESQEGLLQGVKMVADQLRMVLEQHQCQSIECAGETFDPALHEAIAQEPSDQPKGTVLRVVQTGYQLHDRTIRPAQVVVSAGAVEPGASGETSDGGNASGAEA